MLNRGHLSCSWHQTTNLVHEFFSVLAVEKEKRFFFSFGPIKVCFFFNYSNWEKYWGKQNWLFGGLMFVLMLSIDKNGITGIVNYIISSLACLKFIAASLLKIRRVKTKSYKNWTFQADIKCIPTEISTMKIPYYQNGLKWTRKEVLNLFPFVFYIVLNIMI